jgi:methylated-DNA-[protein]-cysteine S-methyltransferase
MGTRATAVRKASRQRRPAASGGAIAWGSVETHLGRVFAAASERGVVAVSLPGADGARFRERAGLGAEPPRPSPMLDKALRQVREYFEGKRKSFDVPLDLRVSPFVKRVLDAIRRMPAGTVTTYGEVAKAVGSPGAARAVGMALGRNPIPILLPCHRVVASSGLGGFAGKERLLDVKRKLLEFEGACDCC